MHIAVARGWPFVEASHVVGRGGDSSCRKSRVIKKVTIGGATIITDALVVAQPQVGCSGTERRSIDIQ